MKTIAVVISNGWAVKEYLLSDFLTALASCARVVLLSPLGEDPGFRRRFEGGNVVVETMNVPPLSRIGREVEELLKVAHFHRHPSVMGRLDMAFRDQKYKRARVPIRRMLKLRVVRPVTQFVARSVFTHLTIEQQLLIEKLVYLSLREESRRLAQVLERHGVDLLFSTMPVVAYFDRPAVWAAGQAGIPAACIVPGWDNLHSKGRLPVCFTHVLVWSEWMAEILRTQYPEISPDRISVTGPLFMDFYFRDELRAGRKEFIGGLGGDPERPLIVWATAPRSQTPNQPAMIEEFWEAVKRGCVRGRPQLLVRPHPVGGGVHFADFRARHPEVLFTETNSDDPGSGTRWNPSLEDTRILVNSVAHADVMVNFSSTITLEAFVVDRPVVNLAYDAERGSDYERFTRGAYETESYRPVVELEATKVARSPQELVEHVNAYLEDPAQDREKRAALLRLICSEVDGRAAQRAADILACLVDPPATPRVAGSKVMAEADRSGS